MDSVQDHHGLDAHEKPPEALRVLFKKYQKIDARILADDSNVIDWEREKLSQKLSFKELGSLSAAKLRTVFDTFEHQENHGNSKARSRIDKNITDDILILESVTVPGLLFLPSLFPVSVQAVLLERLFFRDLSDPTHQTNLHLFHDVQYPEVSARPDGTYSIPSFFSTNPDTLFQPRDLSVHKPISVRSALERKLRWITLGGQYDWTAKRYPDTKPPEFPGDIQELLQSLFPDIVSQAAIVNLYSPGDILSMHRDVSEYCDRGLISISIGCDALFVVGNSNGTAVTMRLRSGDAVCMTGPARWAWHGVPKVVSQTCPEDLKDWPVLDQESEALDCWRGWMSRKRINVNVRQMTDMHRHLG